MLPEKISVFVLAIVDAGVIIRAPGASEAAAFHADVGEIHHGRVCEKTAFKALHHAEKVRLVRVTLVRISTRRSPGSTGCMGSEAHSKANWARLADTPVEGKCLAHALQKQAAEGKKPLLLGSFRRSSMSAV